MDMNFKQLMADAKRLTHAGDLSAATRAIQQALGGHAGADHPKADPASGGRDAPTPNADPSRVIEGEWTRMDDEASDPGADSRADHGSDHGADKSTDESRARTNHATGERTHARGTATPERIVRARHTDKKGSLDYRLFVPARASDAPPPPLLVMLHGCTQNAEDFAVGTGMDELARRHGCLVLYPDQSDRANPQRCWNWFKHTHQRRGGGEAGLIEGCVRALAAEHGVDQRRIFVAGLSAGGAMAAILGSVCPDVFAGVGVHSGLAAGAATNLPEALAAMQRGAPTSVVAQGKVPPTIVFHGDADRTVHPDNGERIIEGWQQAAGATTGSAAPTVQRQAGDRGKRGWTRRVHRDAGGRILAEHWCVHGAAHAWSGGDRRGSYTDASGPDASAEMLRFFLALVPA